MGNDQPMALPGALDDNLLGGPEALRLQGLERLIELAVAATRHGEDELEPPRDVLQGAF